MELEHLKDFSRKKKIPPEIMIVALRALSFYPELMDVKIEFKFKNNIRKSVMQAQPKFSTMLRSGRKRTYIVKISRWFSLVGKRIYLHELPEKVLIGWLGHELGHVMDYLRKDAWSMTLFGIGYISSKNFIMSTERLADTYAVNHGLGDYILATKKFILNQAGMPEKYINKINKLYLPPEEIIEMIEHRQLVTAVGANYGQS